jgi:hypothetical protein
VNPTRADDGPDGGTSTTTGSEALVTVLAAAIAGYRVRRVPLTALRVAFAQHDPTGAASSGARARLRAAIDELATQGRVVLPKQKQSYEAHVVPELPTWVERSAAPRAARPESPVRVWRPELAAAAELATAPAEFDILACVDAFLRDSGSNRPLVPHRERSLEVFGNEKRLDALVRTRLFASGALTLDLLRCYQPPLPLTAQYVGQPGSNPHLLIVENHATYASVLAAARERVAEGVAGFGVGYGAGNQLPKAIGGAAQLDPPPAAIWYFGDLDVEGLRIAADAAAAAINQGLPSIRPAAPLYQALLDGGVRQRGKKTLDETTAWKAAAWLDDSLRSAAAAVLFAGMRIAQESVGYETLVRCAIWW